jgi:hypothetical protein
VVDVRRFPLIPKFLSFVVMALLLVLPLASLTAESAFTSCDNASREFSLQVHHNGNTEDYFLRAESELSFSVDLVPIDELCLPGARLQLLLKPALADLSLKDIIAEIFIPPKIVS